MSTTFGGGKYVTQCPCCDAALDWRSVGTGRANRVAAARHQHDPRCPVTAVDPARLSRCRTPQEALALVGGERS